MKISELVCVRTHYLLYHHILSYFVRYRSYLNAREAKKIAVFGNRSYGGSYCPNPCLVYIRTVHTVQVYVYYRVVVMYSEYDCTVYSVQYEYSNLQRPCKHQARVLCSCGFPWSLLVLANRTLVHEMSYVHLSNRPPPQQSGDNHSQISSVLIHFTASESTDHAARHDIISTATHGFSRTCCSSTADDCCANNKWSESHLRPGGNPIEALDGKYDANYCTLSKNGTNRGRCIWSSIQSSLR